MSGKRLISFDWAMKRLLRNKAGYTIFEGFLSELLRDDIKIKNILKSESNRENREDRSNRVDMLVETGRGELVIVEIQREPNTTIYSESFSEPRSCCWNI
jgi:predicted transposase/invertase (TIGR01784 family)